MHERDVELAALGTFRTLGYDLRHGPELGPDAPGAERKDLQVAILTGRVRENLRRLNPYLAADSIDGLVRTLSHPPHPTLAGNNRWHHALLTDGMETEYRDAEIGEIRGSKARLVDFDDPASND